MKPEIEATFINIDKDALRQQLKALGGKLLQPETLMTRHIFAIDEHSFVRVRNEGNRITITYKHHDALTLSGTKEINLTIDDYDAAIELLKALGLEVKAVQETLREEWELNGVEIDIDTWPWLPTYVEIEGPNEAAVQKVSEKLGFKMIDAVYGLVDEVYKLYFDVTSHEVNQEWHEIKFIGNPDGANPAPKWLEHRRLAKQPHGQAH